MLRKKVLNLYGLLHQKLTLAKKKLKLLELLK